MGGGFGGQSGAFGDKEEGKQNKKNKKKDWGCRLEIGNLSQRSNQKQIKRDL